MKGIFKTAAILAAMTACLFSQAQETDGTVTRSRKTIRIAASDSAPEDKSGADIVCSGKHDEVTLQDALLSLGSYGTLELAVGSYNIDGFFIGEDGSGYALRTNFYSNIRIEGDLPDWAGKGARLMISKECYESLDDKRIYSVIGGTKGEGYYPTMTQNVELENLCIYLPGNQKRIICIDGYNLGRISADRCECRQPDNNRDTEIKLGVMDCVGIRGVQGSGPGTATEFNNCKVVGLGVGFALSGEHLILVNSTAIGNVYGYTFNQYENSFPGSAQVHPITLIGCHDEVSANYPKFYDNPLGQSVVMINFGVEHYPKNRALGGDYATETTPGQWHGTITYAIQNFNQGDEWIRNSPTIPFWAPGSGIAFESRNNTHKSIVTSEERRSYAPNLGQTVFDTDLGKNVTCIDTWNKVWVDAKGKKVK